MRRFVLILALALLLSGHAAAQEVLLDQSLDVAGVKLFASRTDPHAWYYLPDEPRISLNDAGEPEFSLVKYTAPPEARGEGGKGITAARGGGVLHMLATYGVTEDRLARAEQALRSEPSRRDDRIVGPIQYRAGTFALVSSAADPGGTMTRKVTGTGRAPLLEGGKIAVSVALEPEGATFLWKSFHMSTPDVSLAFSMEMEGFRTPYEAVLEVDWDRVYSRHDIEARAKIYFVGIEVEALLEDLYTEGAIRVEVKGESASMEKLLESAYSRVAELLFDPAPPLDTEEDSPEVGGLVSDLVGGLKSAATSASNVDLFAGYKLTKVRRSGKGRIQLHQQRSERQFILLTKNVGPLARRWGTDERFFRAVSLEDPAFRQREVAFSFDGDAQYFARVVNHLVVQLKKEHQDGTVTMREAALDPASLSAGGSQVVFAYPNAGDADLDAWLRYRWRAVWSFRGGRSHDLGWQEADAFAVALRPPYQVRPILFDGDPQVLESAGVRSVLARIEWDFLGEKRTERLTLRPGHWSTEVDLVLPADRPVFDVSLQWHLRGGSTLNRERREEESGIVFVDELPDPEDLGAGANKGELQ